MRKFLIAGLLFAAVAVQARTVTSLDGEGWKVEGESVRVPHCWNAVDAADGAPTWLPHGGDTYLRGRFVYARDLSAPTKGKRQFLRFDGVSQKAEVWVNGKLVGSHAGAFAAFAFEITHALKEKDNRLEVVVDNRYDVDVPPADRCDFSIFGGIYRSVWLIETDAACIDPAYYGGPGVSVRATADGRITAEARLSGTSSAAKVTCRIVETDDRFSPGAFTLAGAKTWSPETPVLYHLEVTLRDGDSVDSVTVPFGFRTVAFRKDGFYLNGKKRKLRGVCRHQDREGRGWALLPEDAPEDFALMKKMGVDAVRTAHYPNGAQVYDLCDEQGFLAWCELPLVGGVTRSAAFRGNTAEMQREMVAQLGNHPSIFAWSVFNEITQEHQNVANEAVEILREANERFHRLDPSRTVVAATNDRDLKSENAVPDELAINIYPGWYGGSTDDFGPTIDAFLKDTGRTTIGVSEYGAGADVFAHGAVESRPVARSHFHPEEYQAWYHREAYRQIAAHERVWGSFVWNMFDFASDWRREGHHDGMNDKGLVTYDRRTPKDAYYFYKANWNPEPMLHLVGRRMRETTLRRMSVLGFSNCAEVTLIVNGERVGAQKPDEVKSVMWKDVPLKEGPNIIELTAGDFREVALWDVTARTPPLNTNRTEVIAYFSENVYGVRPDLSGFHKKCEVADRGIERSLKARRLDVSLNVATPLGERVFTAAAFLPESATAQRPVPVFVCPQFAKIDDMLAKREGSKPHRCPLSKILERGYAAVAFYYCDVFPDEHESAETFGRAPTRAANGWGAISAWALAAGRVADWIGSEPRLDAKKIAIVGHSRLGKTALWAGATDTRFALTCVNDSGCMGARASTWNIADPDKVRWNHHSAHCGETIEAITDAFPHWFAPNLRAKFANCESNLPFDQHWLVAAIAPRLVAVGSAADDHWACPSGEEAGLELARPAWGAAQDRCHYHVRTGGHDLNAADWKEYLDFAAYHGW